MEYCDRLIYYSAGQKEVIQKVIADYKKPENVKRREERLRDMLEDEDNISVKTYDLEEED